MKSCIIMAVPLLLAAVTLSSDAAPAGKAVPLLKVGSKTFYIVGEGQPVQWVEAQNICKQAGLTTAVVSNTAESDALAAKSLERAQQDKEYFFWLGATLRRNDLKWVWAANGQELSFTDWRDDAILDDPGTSPTSGYNCGFIGPSKGWRTAACGKEHLEAYTPLCQKA